VVVTVRAGKCRGESAFRLPLLSPGSLDGGDGPRDEGQRGKPSRTTEIAPVSEDVLTAVDRFEYIDDTTTREPS
jgi:hypothetical protein